MLSYRRESTLQGALILAKSGRQELAISLQRRPVDPKFHVEGVAPHQPFFFSEN